MKRALFLSIAAVAAATSLIAPSGADAASGAAYDSTQSVLPGNVPSVGLEAYSANEIGDEITLQPGTGRKLNNVTVTMSSWACQSGAWNTKDCSTKPGAKSSVPITLNIYKQSKTNADGTVTPGRLITRVTKSFSLPYRPSANFTKCTGANAGKWFNTADQTCYNGKAANIVFNFTSLAMTLPDTVVMSVSYDTTNHGYEPVGSAPCVTASGGCFYDSLNVATSGTGPTVGSKPTPDTIFWDTTFPGNLCDSTPTPGVFGQDSPTNHCWTDSALNFKVTTS